MMFKIATLVAMLAASAVAQLPDNCSPEGPTIAPLVVNDVWNVRPANTCTKIFKHNVPEWFNPEFHCAGIEVRDFVLANGNNTVFPLHIDTYNDCTGEFGALDLVDADGDRLADGGRAYVGVPVRDACNLLMKLDREPSALLVEIKWGVSACP